MESAWEPGSFLHSSHWAIISNRATADWRSSRTFRANISAGPAGFRLRLAGSGAARNGGPAGIRWLQPPESRAATGRDFSVRPSFSTSWHVQAERQSLARPPARQNRVAGVSDERRIRGGNAQEVTNELDAWAKLRSGGM